ncbi:hypothetical protein CARUB_v10021472mg [Capsella rubella]|uniref:DUF4283 domain-containing protein n=1 Tax=Capsella rubella TaxID=81985 RepID=R0GDY2_9BRAS|nr:hypothetical protein CARUB_v10021472mg [Capsella rubella]
MMDITEKGNPREIRRIRLNRGCQSWWEVMEGGRLKPERVLPAAFVEERLTLEFPDGEDGEPLITVGQEVVDAMHGLWRNCMIVKVLGRSISIRGMYVLDLPRQFFMVRFDAEEEYLAALTGGPWRIFGSHLMVQGWTPAFNPLRDEIVTTPVWVRVSNIPEGLNMICAGCRVYGHSIHACPRGGVVNRVEQRNSQEEVIERSGSPIARGEKTATNLTVTNVEFTEVRRSGRKHGGLLRDARVPRTEKEAVISGKNPNAIFSKDLGNVDISNRFGGLDVEEIAPKLMEVQISSEANKENVPFRMGAHKGLPNSQVRARGASVASGKERGFVLSGPKGRKAQPNNKLVETNGPRGKGQKTNRPARGLIFGPI